MNLRATITLLVVAVIMVVSIFAVNTLTRPLILEERVRRENETYFGIVEEATFIEEVTEEYQPLDLISNIYSMTLDGEPYVYVYQATTKGFSDGLEFLLFAYSDRESIAGIRILNHNETPEYGGKVLDDTTYLSTFFDVLNEQIINLGIDQVAGATMTIQGLEKAVQEVIAFHYNVVINVEIPEPPVIPDVTPPLVEILARNKTFKEGQSAPDYASYLSVSDNEDDSPIVTINSSSVDMNTPGEYQVLVSVIDESGNETTTSFFITVVAEEVEIIIVITPPPDERAELFEELYPSSTQLSEETSQFVLADPITNIYRIEENEIILSTVYEASVEGFVDNIAMLLFVNPTGEVQRLEILSHRESRGYGADLISDSAFIDKFINSTISSPATIDSYGGATITGEAISTSIQAILEFHQETFTE